MKKLTRKSVINILGVISIILLFTIIISCSSKTENNYLENARNLYKKGAIKTVG